MKCPYCMEEISDEAKKCKHCGERLEDEHIKKTNKKSTTAGTSIINFIKFLGFIISVIVFSILSLLAIRLSMLLFSMLNTKLIVFLALSTGLFLMIGYFLLVGLGYLIKTIFKIPTNKKLARIFFIIIYILICIFEIVGTRTIETEVSNTFNVFYTLIVIFVCVFITIKLKDILEDDNFLS